MIFNEKAPRLFEQYGQELYSFALSRAIFDRITEQGASQRCHVSYQYFYQLYCHDYYNHSLLYILEPYFLQILHLADYLYCEKLVAFLILLIILLLIQH